MRKTSEKEMAGVLRLDPRGRYKHFVKRVTNSHAAWGLWQDGWAMMGDDEGKQVFPLWPAREYAEAAKDVEWGDYEPKQIDLDQLLEDVLPQLAAEETPVGVFPTPKGNAAVVPPAELEASLRLELREWYGE